MDEKTFTTKANSVLTLLEANQIGELDAVIRATIAVGLTADTDGEREQFWNSIQALVQSVLSVYPHLLSTINPNLDQVHDNGPAVCGFCNLRYTTCECFSW
jgi:hypothetical protein